MRPFAIQFVGQALLGGLAWYWLSLGVSSTMLVVVNALFAVGLIVGWSVLSAIGLGALKHWVRAVPAVALAPLMGAHVGLAVLIPFAWLIVLFPSVAGGKWKVVTAPGYVAVCAGILLVMTVVPAALLNWIPAVNGLTGQLASFSLRVLLAYGVFVGGWAVLLDYIRTSVTGGDEGESAVVR